MPTSTMMFTRGEEAKTYGCCSACFSQKGLIVILNIMVGHFADQVVNRLAKLFFIVLKTEKSLIYNILLKN